MPKLYGLLAFLAFIAAAYWWVDHHAYARGFAASEARHATQIAAIQRDLDQAATDLRTDAADLENYKDAARILAQEADNAITANPDPACVPSADELRRTKRRWGVSD